MLSSGALQSCQLEQTLDEANGLSQRQAEQVLDGQTELNGRIVVGWCPTSLSLRPCLSCHARVQPDGQGAALDQDLVIGFPVGSSVLLRRGLVM